jgi:type I restriction enzyme, S subunit
MSVKANFRTPTSRLGDFIRVRRGISWDQSMERDAPSTSTYPVLRIPNVQASLELHDVLYLAGISTDAAARFGAAKGWTILVASNGNPDRVGNPVYVDEDRGFLFASFLMAVAPVPGSALDPKYLYHYLNSPAIQQAITESVQGTTGLKNLSQRTLLDLPLPRYSESEQRRIADILDTLDAAIQATEALIAKARQAKAGLLHDLLTRGIDENGHSRDPDAHPEQFKDSALGRIPREWDALPLSSVADLQVGYAFKSTWFEDLEGIRLLRGENVGVGVPDWSETKRLPWKMHPLYQEYELSEGDIIIGMDRTFTKQGYKISVVTSDDVPCLLVQRVGRFVPTTCLSGFLKAVLDSALYRNSLAAQQKGMDIPHLSRAEILSPLIPVPPRKEQEQISEVVSVYDARVQSEQASLGKLVNSKYGLMDDLLTGRVRVSDVERIAV